MTQVKALRGVKAAAEGRVTAVFSVFDVVDHDGDVLTRGAFTEGAAVVISAYGHRSHTGALPVGKGRIRTTATEAVLEGQFFMDTTAGRDTFEVVKELGELQEWSYSLHDVRSHRDEVGGQMANVITAVRVKEVSPVLLGAGIGTRTLAAKALGDAGDLRRVLLEHRIREFERRFPAAGGAR